MDCSKLTVWVCEWAALWLVDDLTECVQIEPGPRLRRSLGRCNPETGNIRIHPALYDRENADLLREVVCHEVAHVAVHLLHGKTSRSHGPEWRRLVAAAGYTPSTRMDPQRLPRRLRAATVPKVLYRHVCPVCGATRMAGRRVRSWRCRTCRESGLEGLLQVVSVTRTEEL